MEVTRPQADKQEILGHSGLYHVISSPRPQRIAHGNAHPADSVKANLPLSFSSRRIDAPGLGVRWTLVYQTETTGGSGQSAGTRNIAKISRIKIFRVVTDPTRTRGGHPAGRVSRRTRERFS
jgi:hypothetical protein